MADVLPAFPAPTGYPWSEWTDGQPRMAVHGQDFTCEPRQFQKYLHEHAAKVPGRKVTTTITGDAVAFQFTEGK